MSDKKKLNKFLLLTKIVAILAGILILMTLRQKINLSFPPRKSIEDDAKKGEFTD